VETKDERTGAGDSKCWPAILRSAREDDTLNESLVVDDESHAVNDGLSSVTVDPEIYRQLIQQFYQTSIQRYGADSEQSRMFQLHLTANSGNAA
jgi:hypothetical protein